MTRAAKARSREAGLVRTLAECFAAGVDRVATVGIGDDAAVLRPTTGPFVWTIDTSVEGVHFDRRWLSLADIGARSFHAAVSDVAAMGARPLSALSNLIVPPALGEAAIRRIARGQARAARELGCPVVGGNLARGAELSITTTVIGKTRAPLTRAAARPGDELWLVGDVGLARAGLRWLALGRRTARLDAAARKAVAAGIAAWRSPRALVREGCRLNGRAHAAIDVSDGLAGDAAHLAEASRVRVVLEEPAIRRVLRPELLRLCELLELDALALALAGGEDYALVATGSASRRPRGARLIGRVEKGRGLRVEDAGGRLRAAPSGFDHFYLH